MSEIKFRAWDKVNKVMYTGLPYSYAGRNRLDDFSQILKHPQIYEVMQYTGLKDKNGIEIYEGDIVNMHYFFESYDRETLGAFEDETEVVGVVRIDEMSVYTDCKEGRFDWLNYLEEPTEELEVIGNIYDNPELLEVSE